jgi:type I restriction enzyme M protein
VLFGGTKAAVKIRELLLREYGLQAIINLPSGTFKPYSGVGTAILIFDKAKAKRGKDDFIWFYDLTADGFSLDDKRTPIEANDIPDVLAKWEKREEGKNSIGGGFAYRVPIEKIWENKDRSLATGRFKPMIVDVTQYDAPQDILRDVLALEDEITNRTNSLVKSLK